MQRFVESLLACFHRAFSSYETLNSTVNNRQQPMPMSAAALYTDERKIAFNSATGQSRRFCTNSISTCKYNVFTFLFLFLYDQFRHYNNVFFLAVSLFQQIPDISPTGRYVTLVPFMFILMVSAIKEIYEDIKRRRSDLRVNNFYTRVLKCGHWTRTKWKDVTVGDIVRIGNEELFPADIVLLASSEPEAMAYIETSNLDGETSLKIKQGLPITADLITLHSISTAKFLIECEKPNRFIDEFNGVLHMNEFRHPLQIEHLLLRGSKLKNTCWIYGGVVYTGHDAKVMMNSNTAPLKMSTVDTITNGRIIFLFFVLVAISLLSALGAMLFNKFYSTEADYLGLKGAERNSFLWNIVVFFLLYNNLIPISLNVTLELVRFFQATYISNDVEMYDEESDTPAVARASHLTDELGQVKFVMCDKTGTLTRNVMSFKRCSIGGTSYGDDTGTQFSDSDLLQSLQSGDERARYSKEFLRIMSVCHTVVPQIDDKKQIKYQASSPDESALVNAAASIGFVFKVRKPNLVVIDALGEEEMFELLNVIEFTSDRKRMSIIVRCADSTIRLYTKGADSVLFDKIQPDSPNRESCIAHLVEYASKGYRTLCFAMRIIEEVEYQRWAADFRIASTALENRAKKIAECAENIEKDLELIGASAIEDKLQQEVPETIKALMDAAIRVWMLTGDKRETAINVAFASELCDSSTIKFNLDSISYDQTYYLLMSLIDRVGRLKQSNKSCMLIVEGASLLHALTSECRNLFAELAFLCRSVICCRMTPMQKAEVVEVIKSKHVVLAIGDGANDVAMLQAANVGVGICGEEGLQAASASDYSIAQFRFLRRLLLVHGSWNFDRCIKVILYSFYKNICLYMIELWFALYSAFSGQPLFERWTIGLYNVMFTSMPVIFLGLFDHPISEATIQKYPVIYLSLYRRLLSKTLFFSWISVAVLHSIVLYFLSHLIFSKSVAWSNGRDGGNLMLGNSCYTFVVIAVSLKVLLESDSWTTLLVYSVVGSVASWFIFLIVYSVCWPFVSIGADMTGLAPIMFTSYEFWLGCLLVPVTALLCDIVAKVSRTTISPSPRDLVCLHERTICDRSVELSGIETNYFDESGGVINEALSLESSNSSGSAVSCFITEGKSHPYISSDRSIRSTQALNALPSVKSRILSEAIGGSENAGLAADEQHGFAFSQDESGVVSQSSIIRKYDSTITKPCGL